MKHMVIFVILIAIMLVILTATRPVYLEISDFELNRRSQSGNLSRLDEKRARHADAVAVLLNIIQAGLLVALVLVAVAILGWTTGVVASVILVMLYQPLASLKLVRNLAAWLYTSYERYLLAFCQKFPSLAKHLASLGELSRGRYQKTKVYSKGELIDLIKHSPNVLSKVETKLLGSVLEFNGRVIGDIMTPRSMIDSVAHGELLGPITLNELHKTGHSRFPVVGDDIDHVVGMLYVRNLLTVDANKKSPKVSQVMDKEVCFVRQDQSLDRALAAFLKTKKLLFVVVNEFRETVGLVSLEDVIEALLGQKIDDEFEKHSDLRAVAERNPRKNNSPEKLRNV